jgi:hypothetical protein
VVRFREQLGSRPSAQRLYQGYPFDRLRRRLGLDLADAAAVDATDLSCASPEELDRLDPSALDDHRLADAVESAAGLRDDVRTARLAAELIRRRPRLHQGAAHVDLTAAVSALVRQAMSHHDFDKALNWIEQARPLGDARTAATLDIWRAEILARASRPEEALRVYLRLIQPDSAGAAPALDGALTLLDNNHLAQAEVLLKMARDRARSTGRRWIERRARELLERL